MSSQHQSGLLISFDGLDSTGKETQTNALVAHLLRVGHTVTQLRSPDYATPSGKELQLRLQNKIGNWEATPWQEKMAFFANNRAEHKEQVFDALSKGHIVVYDRYVPSSVAFMCVEAFSKSITEEDRRMVKRLVEQTEYDISGMPHEHVSIFLDVSPVVSAILLEKRKKINNDHDEYTDSEDVQRRLYSEYDVLCNDDPDRFLRITCTDGQNFLPVETISSFVWKDLIARFPLLERRNSA